MRPSMCAPSLIDVVGVMEFVVRSRDFSRTSSGPRTRGRGSSIRGRIGGNIEGSQIDGAETVTLVPVEVSAEALD